MDEDQISDYRIKYIADKTNIDEDIIKKVLEVDIEYLDLVVYELLSNK